MTVFSTLALYYKRSVQRMRPIEASISLKKGNTEVLLGQSVTVVPIDITLPASIPNFEISSLKEIPILLRKGGTEIVTGKTTEDIGSKFNVRKGTNEILQGKQATLVPITFFNAPLFEGYYTTPNESSTYYWEVPLGVTSINAVAIGGGGGGANGDGAAGGGGGGLAWKNNIPVTPGEILTIYVGAGGSGAVGLGQTGGNGGTTTISRGSSVLLQATGGSGGSSYGGGGVGGTPGPTADGGGNGGTGGNGVYGGDAGGGGAGGWTGNGGFGAGAIIAGPYDGSDGAGGGGGGGGTIFPGGGTSLGGGGTNPQGQGLGGRFGDVGSVSYDPVMTGKGGSAFGSTDFDAPTTGVGGYPGGGGGDTSNGANGAVNIIWGPEASFPRGNPPTSALTYQIYDTHGTYYWRAPAGVTSVNVACVGGGGGGGGSKDGGAGGGLGWKNNIPVTPGQDYLVVVGSAGQPNFYIDNGGDSYFIDSTTVKGGGGGSGSISIGGDWAGDGGYSGGRGGNGNLFLNGNAGGGSAATFSGPGADGTSQTGNQNYGPGTAVSLRGVSGPENSDTQRAGRFGAGARGNDTSTDYLGSGGSGGVWIDWTPGGSFPSLGI